jgi:hypothetical protein
VEQKQFKLFNLISNQEVVSGFFGNAFHLEGLERQWGLMGQDQ